MNKSWVTNLLVWAISVICFGKTCIQYILTFLRHLAECAISCYWKKLKQWVCRVSSDGGLEATLKKENRVILKNTWASKTIIDVTSGVPQGGHLSPLLFNCFVYDICDVMATCKFLVYGDYLKIFSIISCRKDSGFMV